MSDPTTSQPSGVETKVTVASLLALLAGVALAILNAVQADSEILGSLNPTVQFLLVAAIPPVAAFLGGYLAPHTDRAVRGTPPLG